MGNLKNLFSGKREEKAAAKPEVQLSDDNPAAVLLKLIEDIKNEALPNVSEPTEEQLSEYIQRKQQPITDVSNGERLRANLEIPAEIDFWVDKVCEQYFKDVPPMFGLVHTIEDAKKPCINTGAVNGINYRNSPIRFMINKNAVSKRGGVFIMGNGIQRAADCRPYGITLLKSINKL